MLHVVWCWCCASKVNEDPVESVQNLADAALYINVKPSESGRYNSRVTVVIEASQFVDNERGLTLFGALSNTSVIDCEFSDNVAMHAGAGMLVLVDVNSPPIDARRCTFNRNKAGLYRPTKVVNYQEQFRVNGDEVGVNLYSMLLYVVRLSWSNLLTRVIHLPIADQVVLLHRLN